MKTRLYGKLPALLLIILSFAERSQAQVNFYVSPQGDDNNVGSLAAPFKTIQKARDVIRIHPDKATSSYVVLLRGGTYPLSSATSFNASDGGVGTNTVTYSNYQSEVPVITGGQTVTGWMQVPGKPYWQAPVAYNAFRQLYVKGNRKQRARSKPILGINAVEPAVVSTAISGYTVDTADAAIYQNVQDVEIHQQIEWSDGFFPVTSMTKSGNKVTITAPSLNDIFFIGPNSYAPFYLENALELLDEPGEWYCDKTTNIVYYYPEADENLGTTLVIIPVGEEFLRIVGTKAAPVKNLQFSGITFEYAGWAAPNRTGWINLQSNITYKPTNGQAKSHIYTEHTDRLSLTGCTFRHFGAVGLELRNGSQYSNVSGNRFYDIGDAAISISSPQHNFLDLSTENGNDYITVTNNAIYATGRENRGSVAIMAYYVTGLKVEHNQIYDVPYTAISVGWGWNGQPTSTTCKENTTRYNKIGFFMNQMKDGGGFYSLGQQPNSTCSNNYFYNGIYNHAIYYDEGSKFSTCNNNVISDCRNWMQIHGPGAENLSFDNNYSTTSSYVLSSAGANISITNTQYAPDGVTLPAGAQPIIDFSGLEPAYQTLSDIFPIAANTPAPVISGIATSYNTGLDQTLHISPSVSAGSNSTAYPAYTWKQIAGPAPITFSSRTLVWNKLSFYKSGAYTVEFQINDGITKTKKTFNVIVSNYNFGSNRALNMPATASSSYDASLTPNKAVDQSISTIWHPSQAQTGDRSWWQVDAGTAIRIKRFELTTRQSNPQGPTRKNFQIVGSNDPNFTTYEAIGGIGPDTMQYLSTVVFNVPLPASYRYYRVRKIFKENHTIAEFAAYSLSLPEFKASAAYNGTGTLIQWDGLAAATTYVVERKSSSETVFTPIASLGVGTTAFTDMTAVYSASVPYNTYRVKALETAGEYAATNEVTVYPESMAGSVQSLAEWNFGVNTLSYTPSFIRSGVSAYETILTPFVNASATGGTNNGVASDKTMTTSNSITGQINNNVFTFKIKSDNNNTISVSGISLDVRGVSNSGITNWLPYDVKWGSDGTNFPNATTVPAFDINGTPYQNRLATFAGSPMNVAGDIFFQVTVNGTTTGTAGSIFYGMDNVRILGTVNSGAALPVTLLSFNARAEGKRVKLEWSTSFEQNNNRYELLRSGDNINFVLLTTVRGKNVLSGSVYIEFDDNPFHGNNYYKLLQYDKDGRMTILGTRLVKVILQRGKINIYPNPSKGIFTVLLPNAAGEYKLVITDLSGKLVYKRTIKQTSIAGVALAVPQKLVTGEYLIKITDVNTNQVTVRKIVLISE